MKNENNDWLDIILKLRGWLTGLISLATTVVGFIELWEGILSNKLE